MRLLMLLVVLVVIAIAALAFGFVDISQTSEAKLPQVTLQGGQAPQFDVDTAKVNVGTREANIAVPEFDVSKKDETVKVPTIGVQKTN